jgi:hypothetical protein
VIDLDPGTLGQIALRPAFMAAHAAEKQFPCPEGHVMAKPDLLLLDASEFSRV